MTEPYIYPLLPGPDHRVGLSIPPEGWCLSSCTSSDQDSSPEAPGSSTSPPRFAGGLLSLLPWDTHLLCVLESPGMTMLSSPLSAPWLGPLLGGRTRVRVSSSPLCGPRSKPPLDPDCEHVTGPVTGTLQPPQHSCANVCTGGSEQKGLSQAPGHAQCLPGNAEVRLQEIAGGGRMGQGWGGGPARLEGGRWHGACRTPGRKGPWAAGEGFARLSEATRHWNRGGQMLFRNLV